MVIISEINLIMKLTGVFNFSFKLLGHNVKGIWNYLD